MKIKKRKIFFLLNFYDEFNSNLKKKRKFSFNHNSWEKIFSSLASNRFDTKIIYLNLLKKKFKDDNYLNYLDIEIKKFKPNLLISTANNSKIHQLILRNKKIYNKSIIMHSAYLSKQQVLNFKKIYDMIITANKKVVYLSKKNNFRNSYLELSVPKNYLKKKKKFKDKINKIFFSGSLGYQFKHRNKILIFLSKEFKNIDFRLRNIYENFYLLNILNKILIKYLPKISYYLYKKKFLPVTNKLKLYSKNPVFGQKLINSINKNKFIINCNSDFDKNTCINLRTYETLSQGSILFTDENKLMRKYFKHMKHVVYYKNASDLKKKILRIINNPKLSLKISNEAIKIIKRYHTSEYRYKKFYSIISRL